ncbi:hypothetical protein [Nostoc sp. CHAB 5715]|uniref:hypothetical protein n=1 Tax=Nostoc sp. CHAB 5715 TaxID=2780400 RepID=UPI001E449CDE|nr:hypothetical protein [Nostoc sp. CHAB 5715]MCC5626336.1 hypothetical protein [Nostoc sp. CHAB 5715]
MPKKRRDRSSEQLKYKVKGDRLPKKRRDRSSEQLKYTVKGDRLPKKRRDRSSDLAVSRSLTSLRSRGSNFCCDSKLTAIFR